MGKLSWLTSLARRTALVAALVITAAAVGACGRTTSGALDDTTITTRVKTAMLNDPLIGGRGIDVATSNGVVTLSGRVNSAAERQQAVTLARRVTGVTDVKDALQVAPEGQEKPQPPAQQPPPPAQQPPPPQ